MVFPCLALCREGAGATRIACRGAPQLVATEPPKVQRRPMVEIRVGYELIYDCPQPTPMMLVLNIHYTRAADILVPDQLTTDPPVPIAAYRDSFGNWCSRIVAPKGQIRIASTEDVNESGEPDVVATSAPHHSNNILLEEALVFQHG